MMYIFMRLKWDRERQSNFKITATKDRVIIKIQLFLTTEPGISTIRNIKRVYEK